MQSDKRCRCGSYQVCFHFRCLRRPVVLLPPILLSFLPQVFCKGSSPLLLPYLAIMFAICHMPPLSSSPGDMLSATQPLLASSWSPRKEKVLPCFLIRPGIQSFFCPCTRIIDKYDAPSTIVKNRLDCSSNGCKAFLEIAVQVSLYWFDSLLLRDVRLCEFGTNLVGYGNPSRCWHSAVVRKSNGCLESTQRLMI